MVQTTTIDVMPINVVRRVNVIFTIVRVKAVIDSGIHLTEKEPLVEPLEEPFGKLADQLAPWQGFTVKNTLLLENIPATIDRITKAY